MPLPALRGPSGPEQAERLLWRAGFGPRLGAESGPAATGLEDAAELVNFGTHAHSLVIESTKSGSKPITFKQVEPSAPTDRTLPATPGRNSLRCSISNQGARGRRATLLVRA